MTLPISSSRDTYVTRVRRCHGKLPEGGSKMRHASRNLLGQRFPASQLIIQERASHQPFVAATAVPNHVPRAAGGQQERSGDGSESGFRRRHAGDRPGRKARRLESWAVRDSRCRRRAALSRQLAARPKANTWSVVSKHRGQYVVERAFVERLRRPPAGNRHCLNVEFGGVDPSRLLPGRRGGGGTLSSGANAWRTAPLTRLGDVGS